MTKQNKYPKYKDSGVEWLGEIPESWEIEKLKFSGFLYPGLTGKKGDDFSKEKKDNYKEFIPFTNIYNNQIIAQDKMQFVRVEKNEEQNIVAENDILFLMSSETLEDIGKNSIYKGETTVFLNSFCKGFRIINNLIFPQFLNLALASDNYRNYFATKGRGFTRINIKQEYVYETPILIPPLTEQTAIASYLDDKTAKIDTAIAQKQKLIALLKERKQILIQNAVTKGLTSTSSATPRKMKNSGVEWIGDIPEGWEVKRLKHLTTKIGSGITPSGGGTIYLDKGIPLLRSQNVLFGKIELNGVAFISKEIHNSMSNSKVIKGDVLLNITGGSIGRCHFIDFDMPLNVNQHVCIVRPSKLITTIFLNSVLSSEIGQGQIWYNQQGGGREGLNFQALKNFFIPTPPLEEQKQISKHIEEQSTKIEQAIAFQEQQIAKLQEYKAVLINSCVTGKVKVC